MRITKTAFAVTALVLGTALSGSAAASATPQTASTGASQCDPGAGRLAKGATAAWVGREATYEERISDHSPVLVDYSVTSGPLTR